jgi:hypothetical protein
VWRDGRRLLLPPGYVVLIVFRWGFIAFGKIIDGPTAVFTKAGGVYSRGGVMRGMHRNTHFN